MAITQEITFATSPQKLYTALTSSAAFSAATNAPAEIATHEGGSFSCFGGQITGRHLELVPNTRIVQAWRAGPWDAGDYSIVRFDIRDSETAAILTLQHSGIPAGSAEHLEAGWNKMYWEPLKAWLS